MNKNLIPFTPSPFSLEFHTHVQWNSLEPQSKLNINYILKGDLEKIELLSPLLKTLPLEWTIKERAHELWKNTCIEWFLGSKNSPIYWEFNLSPNGHWNFYELQNYRQGLIQSELCQPLAIKSLYSKNGLEYILEIRLEVSLNPLLDKYPHLREDGLLAITSVIRWDNTETSYYSLQHPENKPDFHFKEGFKIPLQSCNK